MLHEKKNGTARRVPFNRYKFKGLLLSKVTHENNAADKLKKFSDYIACTRVLAYVISIKQRLILSKSS